MTIKIEAMKKVILSLLCASSLFGATAQETPDKHFTPYKLNYLPAGAPAWMASMANPDGLDYNALVDSFNVYLRDNPGARRKSRDDAQRSDSITFFMASILIVKSCHPDRAERRGISHARFMMTKSIIVSYLIMNCPKNLCVALFIE